MFVNLTKSKTFSTPTPPPKLTNTKAVKQTDKEGTLGKKRPSKASTAALDQAPKKRCKQSSEESEGTETDDSETETEERLDTARSALVALRREHTALKKELAVAMKVGAAETALAVAEARKAGIVSKKEGSAALSAASLKGAAQLAEAKKTLSPHQWLLPRVPLQTLTNSTAWLPF